MRSVLPRANPLVLLAAGLLSIVASLAIRDLTTGLVTVGLYAAAGMMLLPRGHVGWTRLVTVAVAGLSIMYSTWLLGGHDLTTALTAGLRVLVLALPGAVLAAFVDPTALSDQLAQRLRLPARPVVAVAAALQRFERLGQTWQQLDRARRSRGFGATRGPVSRTRHAAALTFGLLVATMRDATTMSLAMDARGFARAHRRTWAEPAQWTPTDTALLLLGIALSAVPFALRLT